MTQLELFPAVTVPVSFLCEPAGSILWDFYLLDHFCRVVLQRGKLWIYHQVPGQERYTGHGLQRIDETHLWIDAQHIATLVLHGAVRRVWPL